MEGGEVVAMGTPEDVAAVEGSWTGRGLKGSAFSELSAACRIF